MNKQKTRVLNLQWVFVKRTRFSDVQLLHNCKLVPTIFLPDEKNVLSIDSKTTLKHYAEIMLMNLILLNPKHGSESAPTISRKYVFLCYDQVENEPKII